MIQCFHALIPKAVTLGDRWSGHDVRGYVNKIHTWRPLENLLQCLLVRDHKKQRTACKPAESPHHTRPRQPLFSDCSHQEL